jgi:hypothetical protein
MRSFSIPAALLLTGALATGVSAQEAESTYTYATYFYCSTATQEQADELVMKNTAPHFDAAVKDGTISGWGWMGHHTGGKWRRIQYHQANGLDALLAAQETVNGRIDKALGGKDDGFSAICASHDDYIWKAETGSSGKTRGKAGLSTYHVCDLNREDRADEIVEKLFAPVLNKAVADGKLTSWGWQSHVVGGKYRRLATMTAANHAGLLKAWGEVLDSIYGDGDNAEANEFSDICNSHSDYLWNIMHEAG